MASDFLVNVPIPQLNDPDFQTRFDEFAQAVHDNFERIISLQFTKGEKGDSVICTKAPVAVQDTSDLYVLTRLGAAFLNTIFDVQVCETYTFTASDPQDTFEGRFLVEETTSNYVKLKVVVCEEENWLNHEFYLAPNPQLGEDLPIFQDEALQQPVPDILVSLTQHDIWTDPSTWQPTTVYFEEGMYVKETPQSYTDPTVDSIINQLAPPVQSLGLPVLNIEDFKSLELDILVSESAGVAYIGNPYIFIDARIPDLKNWVIDQDDPNAYAAFNDWSCMFMGSAIVPQNIVDPTDWASWDWTGKRSQVVPRLYYDTNVREFCWRVNGQETAVTAQGLKGDAGTSTHVHVAKGVVSGNYLIINQVEYIDNSSVDPVRVWHDQNDPDDETNAWRSIRNKDLVLCYYWDDPDDYNNPAKAKAYLGEAIVFSASNNKKIYFGNPEDTDPRMDIFYSIMNETIRDMLDEIGYVAGGDTENGVRGLYVRDKNYGTATTDPIYHMLYVDWENAGGTIQSRGVLRISPVIDPSSYRDTVTPTLHPQYTGTNPPCDFEVDYNVHVQGAEVRNDMHVQGNATFNGDTWVQNLTIQGTLDQHGATTSDLNIAGTLLQGSIQQQNNDSTSRFAEACISQVTNVKTYVSAVKLKDTAQEVETAQQESSYVAMDTIGGLHISPGWWFNVDTLADILNWQSTQPSNTVLASWKLYLGLTFNLHLTIGYLGYGAALERGSLYTRSNSVVAPSGFIEDPSHINMYNVCEYDIPCFVYRELMIGFKRIPGSLPGQPDSYQPRILLWDDTTNAWKDYDTAFVDFESVCAPINFENEVFYPKVRFNATVNAQETDQSRIPSGGDWDAYGKSILTWDSSNPQDNVAGFKLNITFYQGSVDATANQAFGLTTDSISPDIIDTSNVSCLYSIHNLVGSETPQVIGKFIPLWPYQICEQDLGQNRKWKITDQVGLITGNTEQERMEEYRDYIIQYALPRMCAIASGTLNAQSLKVVPDPEDPSVVTYGYRSQFNEENLESQRYLSFVNEGKVDSQGRPVISTPEIDIYRIFRIQNRMDVVDGNMNVCYRRLDEDNGAVEDIQAKMDADQEISGTTGEVEEVQWTLVDGGQLIVIHVGNPTYNTRANRPKYTKSDHTVHVLGHSMLLRTDGTGTSDQQWSGGATVKVAPTNRTIRFEDEANTSVIPANL